MIHRALFLFWVVIYYFFSFFLHFGALCILPCVYGAPFPCAFNIFAYLPIKRKRRSFLSNLSILPWSQMLGPSFLQRRFKVLEWPLSKAFLLGIL